MRGRLKLYLNLALLGFTLGRSYSAFQRRLAKAKRVGREYGTDAAAR
jgi:hypothetical protein